MDPLTTPTVDGPAKPHPLEVQSGTKLRLHIERIPPTSTSVVHISRAIDIANEILLGLFPATFDPASYAEAFGRCRSVALVVACVRTFFEVESGLAEQHERDEIARKAQEAAAAKLRETIVGEKGEREVGTTPTPEVFVVSEGRDGSHRTHPTAPAAHRTSSRRDSSAAA
jgi:hypothetical protein